GDQAFMEENERELWGLFVSQRWLFDDAVDLKRKLILPAPFSKFGTPKDREIPGKAGVWFGWQILQSYWRKHPEVPLADLMATDNASSLFQQSGYRP
ncbi:MAG: gliding motility lipoprotein GldB, partial [Bacteroidota bacterium]